MRFVVIYSFSIDYSSSDLFSMIKIAEAAPGLRRGGIQSVDITLALADQFTKLFFSHRRSTGLARIMKTILVGED